MDLAEIRRQFALKLQSSLELKSSEIVEAFAAVPRESFVGPGPWLVSGGDPYRETPDADPAHLYDDVKVALDPARELNNGNPFNHARWMDRLGVKRCDRVIHVGAGTGYYSAILAAVVGESGSVTALEVDPKLLVQLRRNTARIPQIRVLEPEQLDVAPGSVDRIYVCCALTRPNAWLSALSEGGTLLVPLTEMGPSRHGGIFRIERCGGGTHAAEFIRPIRMYPCSIGRDLEDEKVIAEAFERGGEARVRSLRTDAHAHDAHCWLHAESYCLSELPPLQKALS